MFVGVLVDCKTFVNCNKRQVKENTSLTSFIGQCRYVSSTWTNEPNGLNIVESSYCLTIYIKFVSVTVL